MGGIRSYVLRRDLMGGIRSYVLRFLVLFLFLSLVQNSNCSKKDSAVARKDDVRFIECQVCEILAAQLHRQIIEKQAGLSPKKLSEYEIIELSENVCNLKKEEADWILKIDIQEKGDELLLVEQDSEGQCNSKCKTIERACQEVLAYSDTDVAEFIYIYKPSLDSLVKYLCKDLTKVCNIKPPPLPKDRKPGEPFVPRPSNEAEMNRMLRSMEGMPGAPGMKMYSREELMNTNKFGEDDDDEDDEENASRFPSNLGRILREDDGGGWKRRVEKAITGMRTKVEKGFRGLLQWLKGENQNRNSEF